MSVTIENAYFFAKSLYYDMVVSSCFENSEEWIFSFKRIDDSRPRIPGDWTSPAIVNKSNGAITRLSDRLGGGFKGLLLFQPEERGYTRVDISALYTPEPAVAVHRAVAV